MEHVLGFYRSIYLQMEVEVFLALLARQRYITDTYLHIPQASAAQRWCSASQPLSVATCGTSSR